MSVPASAAALGGPEGLFVDPIGNIYICDCDNYCVRKVSTIGIITTIAGLGYPWLGYSGDGGPAILAKLNNTNGIFVDTANNIFISENNNRIRKVNTAGIITTVAGNGSYGFGGDNGNAIAAELLAPKSLSGDNYGNIYIADRGNNRIRKISPYLEIFSTSGSFYNCIGTTISLNLEVEFPGQKC